MSTVTVTRQELLDRKKRIQLAQQGREMLEQKRAALMQELMQIADEVMAETDVLEEVAEDARRALARAIIIAGPEYVQSAALAARGELPLNVETVNVMGVQVPAIEQKQVHRSLLGRGYAITGTSVSIDEAAEAFETEIEAILKLAESELQLRHLAEEIQRVRRRVNALEHVLLPRLRSDRDYIEMALEERARDEHFRLRLAKRLLERRRT